MDKLSKYEKIIPYQDIEYTVAILNGKAGLITKEGEPLTEFIYDDLEDYYKNEFLDVFDDLGVEDIEHWKLTAYENKKYCSLRLNGKWGLLNNKGEVVLDFKYNSPLKVIERDDLPYHYLNTNVLLNENWEEFIDKNKYDHIAYNATVCALVYFKNLKFGLMNLNCEFVTEPKFDDIDIYNEIPSGAFFVSEDCKKGVIDKDGKVILDSIYDEISYEIKEKEIFFIAKAKNHEFKFNNKGDLLEQTS